MRRDHVLAFDDFFEAGGGGRFSSDELSERLGKYDQRSVFVVVEHAVSTSGTVFAWLQHSADGINFIAKNLVPEVQIAWTALPAQTLVAWGADPGEPTVPAAPALKYVRVYVGTDTSLRVKVYLTLRDQGG